MSDFGKTKTNINSADLLKYVKPQDTAGEQPLELNPTTIVNNCSGTLLWSQSWAGMVTWYGCIPSGLSDTVPHEVVWYDYTFTFAGKSITKTMVPPGSRIILTDGDFR